MIGTRTWSCPRAAPHQGGFTMVELIVVIVLIGILAAMAVPRFFDRSGFEAASFADQSRALLRYAQKAAIARNTPIFVQLDDNRLALCYETPQGNCAVAARVPFPGGAPGDTASDTHCQDEGWYCIGVPDGVQLSLSSAMTEFSFDALGRPVAPNGRFDGLGMTIASGQDTHTVAVNRETGYVQ